MSQQTFVRDKQTILLKRAKYYSSSGQVQPQIRDKILLYGEPLYLQDRNIIVIGDGVMSTTTPGDIEGSTVGELIAANKYFVSSLAPVLAKSDTTYPTSATHTTITDTSTAIATDEFVWNAINTLDLADQGTDKAKTITSLIQNDGKLSYSVTPIEISYSKINDTEFAYVDTESPHVIDDTPKMDGIATVGSIARWAKADHVHPHDADKADVIAPALAVKSEGEITTYPTTVTYPKVDTESQTNTAIANVQYVWNAINTLDSSISNADASKTLNTLTETDGKLSGATWQSISIPYDHINNTTFAYVDTESPHVVDDTPKMDGTASIGSIARWAKADHVHPHDNTKADIAAPQLTSKTESGTTTYPTAPTADTATNNTQIATTAFVHSVTTANQYIYYQTTEPTFSGMTPAEQAMPRIWVDSSTGICKIWDGAGNWHSMYGLWNSNSVI